MSDETQRWRENRAEAERVTPYSEEYLNRTADLWTVGDCGRDLRGIHSDRWSEETRELLYGARDVVAALYHAMAVEVNQ